MQTGLLLYIYLSFQIWKFSIKTIDIYMLSQIPELSGYIKNDRYLSIYQICNDLQQSRSMKLRFTIFKCYPGFK